MGQALLQSGKLLIGVLALFALFMAALFLMERGGRRKQKRPSQPALRVIRCEKQD